MSADFLTKHTRLENIRFGVASPAYQSRSTGTDFEEILGQIREELDVIEQQCTKNLLSPASMSLQKQSAESGVASLLSSPLFKMDTTEFSLLDELLMTALEETRLAAQNAGKEESELEAQVDDRYKMDVSRLGNLLKKLA